MNLPQALEERLTDRVKTVLALAEKICAENSDKEISKEHLIDALFKIRGNIAFNLLNIHGVLAADVTTTYNPIRELKASNGAGIQQTANNRRVKVDLRISPDLKEILKNAMSYASKYNYRYIGTEHILLALLEELRVRLPAAKKILADHLERHLKELLAVSNRVNHKEADLEQIVSPGLGGQGIFDQILRNAYENLRKSGLNPSQAGKLYGKFLRDMSDFDRKLNGLTKGSAAADRVNLPDGLANDLAYEEAQEDQKSALSVFAADLVKQAKKNKLDPVIGREKEIERLATVLCRRTKNNPMLIGEPGVGKTALVLGLAQKIARGQAPALLAKKHIYQLDLGLIVAGTMFRGEFEARFKEILREAEQKEAIIFIDEMHTIVGAGSAQGSLDAANILKPLLPQNRFQVIGATTTAEWRRHIEKDAALERRFQPIVIDEPSINETKNILLGLKPHFESHHKVTITDEAVDAALALSGQYITSRFFPDKAIDVLDEAGAQKKNQNSKIKSQNLLTAEDISRAVSLITHIPIEKLEISEAKKLLNLEKVLAGKIIGQSEAIQAIASALRRARAGIAFAGRPLGSFMFLGPTGVGKTELAKVLAEEVFAHKNALIRVDMSEFSESHSVAKLIGSPPGYVGFEEGGWLTEKVRLNPYSVILFDEIEKAHPQLANVLLQILEDGALTDSHGRKVNFKNTVVIMTSNIGTQDFTREARKFGFISGAKLALADKYENIREKCLTELKRRLRPELISRIDSVIIFNPLGQKEIKSIVKIAADDLNSRLSKKGIALTIKNPALEFIANRAFDVQSGARRVRHLVAQYLENNLAEFMIKNPSKKKMGINIKDGKILIS